MSVRERLERVRARIEEACVRAGREAHEVTLIAVTKTHGAELVNEAIRAGVTEIGENRVQEARDKFPMLEPLRRKHLIGSLQSNKSRQAVELFDVIHSVDSTSLAETLDRQAAKLGRRPDVLVQVNVGAEPQKSGVSLEEAPTLVARVLELENLRLGGLMTIPPIGSPEETRPHFSRLRLLRDELRERFGSAELFELSMGMTSDFTVAIEEGATMVRVGTAIFGERGGR